MDEIESPKGRKVAVAIIQTASQNEQTLLNSWLETLLKIRNSELSRIQKIKSALQSTYESKAIWPLLKLIAAQVQKHGWDKRGSRTRWVTVASAVGIVIFGGQSAGIAALGGAIGVPLWVVFGGGAAFAKVILDEMQRSNKTAKNQVTPSQWLDAATIIDAEFVDITDEAKGN